MATPDDTYHSAAAGVPPTWRDGLREAWAMARPFWRARGQRMAWLQLIAVLALTLGIVWLNVRFSQWNNTFYDALQAHDMTVFWHQLGVFSVLALIYIAVAVVRQVVQQQLTIRWRGWMTETLMARWLRSGTAYRLEAARGSAQGSVAGQGPVNPDNPDQRISEDVNSFVGSTLTLSLGLVNAVVTLVSFVAILWTLSGALHVPWPGGGWDLPGYMVWVALAYSLIGSWLTKRIGAPLIRTNANQQKVEADFRYALVQVRDNAEPIALARGEPAEQRRLIDRFAAIRDNWSLLIRYNKRLTTFNAGFGQMAIIFPFLAAAPRYLAGSIQLGGLMQTSQAFGQVQGAMSWFVDAYSSLADWRATVLRLAGFSAALRADDHAAEAIAAGQRPSEAHEEVQAHALTVAVPRGAHLLHVPALSLRPGERLLVTGPSGSGKSSLLRTLAGLWPARQGSVRVPASAMFIAQRPYLPAGSLAEALAYPHPPARYEHAAMETALLQAGLAARVPELDRAAPWARMLSPGEQQRLQFARVFLQRPPWVLLDEASSALDNPAQDELYRQLIRLLPWTGVLSIGHRAELAAWHRRGMGVRDGVLVEGVAAAQAAPVLPPAA